MATPTRVRQLIGGVWRYVTADEDAGGGSQPVTLTLTASEISARWSVGVGGAYVEWPAITTDSRVLSFVVRDNTLDQNVDSAGFLYAYLVGASSDAVDAGSGTLVAAIRGTSTSTYQSFDALPDTVVDIGAEAAGGANVCRVLDGCAAYVFLSGDAAPTTGEIALELFAL